MRAINKMVFELTSRDLLGLGGVIEECLKEIERIPNGIYKIGDDLDTLITLKVLEGMYEHQEAINKGIRFKGEFNQVLEIYDLKEEQKRMDEAMENFSFEY